MKDLLIVFAAVLPAVVIVAYIYYRDKNRREPLGQIVRGVRYGVISAFMALAFVFPITVLQEMVPVLSYEESLFGAFFSAFFVAAIPEECAKLLMLYLLLRKNRCFDERMDGIFYAVTVGMGFAGLENVGYFFNNIDNLELVGIIRAIFTVPGHFCFAVFMGYYYSLAHFDRNNKRRINLFLMLAVPIVLHGVFDLLPMSMPHLHPALIVMAFMVFLGLCIGMNLIAHIKMRHHIKADKAEIDAAKAAAEAERLAAEAKAVAAGVAEIVDAVEAAAIRKEEREMQCVDEIRRNFGMTRNTDCE